MTIRTEGDEAAAIEALYDAFAPPLYRYAWSLLGDEDQQVAEAVHDGLVAGVVLDARRADPADRGPWLYALVRSACQRRGLAHVSPYTRLATVPAEEPVAHMFSRLPASHRELVELNLRHALSPSAAARVLGLDPKICVELSRSAIQRAAESLEEASGEAGGRSEAPEGTDGPAGPDAEAPEDAGLLGPTRRRAREIDRVAHALSLLRPPGPPPGLRERVVRTCLDPDSASVRERVAAQMHPLTGEGYPLHRARVAGEPEEVAEAAGPVPEPPPRALPVDRLTTRDHPVHEEAVARLAGPDTGPEDGDRTSRRRWPLPAVSGFATVVVAVGLWSWASAVGGPSTAIGPGEADDRSPMVAEREAAATSSDAKPEAGPTDAPVVVPTEQPGQEVPAEPEAEESAGQQAPAPGGTEPVPPAGEQQGPSSGADGSGDGSEAPGDGSSEGGGSGDEDAPGAPPEEGGSDDGDGDEDLFEGLLGLLFGGG
ncbi:DNA-directed RNA polymerase specialized sigma24 family protein [Nocardiopsis arvandica]|uniref:DNA-directed RNA polymerase specialized sigma24 family protein n=1 Tax=Nocardiopsis sinuspersici TaxID=501010 RepID=A0A7Y9XFM6_9ACTN|nr:sigma-70 family RNA polymerase sigma factor [Nocardiopsis sinuspersici]NYH53832.1 DNA-directed RNA polymerase specialized sigma24 family protein [Nocardiopsis sinuspersici]